MSLKNLATKWELPDRSEERKAFSLRLNYDTYAKCLALKETFPNRSLNDILNDLIEGGLDEVIFALPSYKFDIDDAVEHAHFFGGRPEDYEGSMKGPSVTFQLNYARILNDKSNDKSSSESQLEEQEEVA